MGESVLEVSRELLVTQSNCKVDAVGDRNFQTFQDEPAGEFKFDNAMLSEAPKGRVLVPQNSSSGWTAKNFSNVPAA